MCLGIDHFFKNTDKSLFQHFEKETYQYVNITWLLLTGKFVCESPFLILSIAKFLRTHTYFEEHLQTADSENVFMKLRNILFIYYHFIKFIPF